MSRPMIEYCPLDKDTKDRRAFRKELQRRGVTISFAADEMDWRVSCISEWLHHRRSIPEGRILSVAAWCGCSPMTIAKGRLEDMGVGSDPR